MMLNNFFLQSIFNGPSCIQSSASGRSLDFVSCHFEGDSKLNCLTFVFDISMKRRPVSALILTCCPNAIARFVISVAVLSFDSMFCGWPGTHIRKKQFKRNPTLANFNFPSTVSKIHLIGRVSAPTLHSCPSAVFWRSCHSVVSSAVSGVFTHKASTRLYSSRNKVIGKNSRCVSTIANAFPAASPTFVFNPLCYDKTPKAATGQINKARHAKSSLASKSGG